MADIKKILDEYKLAWNSHDANKLLPLFTDDCIYEDVALGVVNHGKKELTAFANSVFADFPDWKFEVKSVFQAGNWVGSEWVMLGTNSHGFMGMPATGKTYSVRGTSIAQLHNGKISRNSDYWNITTLLQQVGLMPAQPK